MVICVNIISPNYFVLLNKLFELQTGIGLCGELCPKECHICHKNIVQDIFFGSEDEPDAHFVLLPDCKHICMY